MATTEARPGMSIPRLVAALTAALGQLACFVLFMLTIDGPSLICEVYMFLGFLLIAVAMALNRSLFRSRTRGWLLTAWLHSLVQAGEIAILVYEFTAHRFP